MNNVTASLRYNKRAELGLPSYTLGEEIVNCLTHALGAVVSIVGVIFLLLKSVNTLEILCSSIFGASLIALYTNSAVYHGAKLNKAKKYFQILDHCTIFLLIAGTYTPYTLITLKGLVGTIIFAVVWLTAIIGVVLNLINMKKFAKFSMACYLLMGWGIITASSQLFRSLDLTGILLLAIGGVAYTIGAVLYGAGKKVKYMHSLWHLFVLGGSILHFFSIYFYVI